MAGTRKIAAILVADIVGYSRLAAADEDRTLSRLRGLRSDLIDPAIDAHRGRIVKRTDDGSLIEFRSVVDAVRCAIEVQTGLAERNAGLSPDRRIEFRVGIHLGDVVEEADGDLMGDGVNIAARLEGIAAPGAICLSEDAYRQVKGRLDLAVSDLGPKELKNIADPVRVYSLEVGKPAQAKAASDTKRPEKRLGSWSRSRVVGRPNSIGCSGGVGSIGRGRLAPLAAPSRPWPRRQGIGCGAAVCKPRRRRGDGQARRRTDRGHHHRLVALSHHGRHRPQFEHLHVDPLGGVDLMLIAPVVLDAAALLLDLLGERLVNARCRAGDAPGGVLNVSHSSTPSFVVRRAAYSRCDLA